MAFKNLERPKALGNSGQLQSGPSPQQPYLVTCTWHTSGPNRSDSTYHTLMKGTDQDVIATVTGPTGKRRGHKTEREHRDRAIVPHR